MFSVTGLNHLSATYHSVIATVKLQGSSFWNFIGVLNIFNRHKSSVNMIPDKITLVTSQC